MVLIPRKHHYVICCCCSWVLEGTKIKKRQYYWHSCTSRFEIYSKYKSTHANFTVLL